MGLVWCAVLILLVRQAGALTEPTIFCSEIKGLENPYASGTCDDGLAIEPRTGCCIKANTTYNGTCETLGQGNDFKTPSNGQCPAGFDTVRIGETLHCCERRNSCVDLDKKQPINGDQCEQGWEYETESYCCVESKVTRQEVDCYKVNPDYQFPYRNRDGTLYCEESYELHDHFECCTPPGQCGIGEVRDEVGRCRKCPEGQYKDSADAAVCRPCYVCEDPPLHRKTVNACNATTQAVCGECIDGYRDSPGFIMDPKERFTYNCYVEYVQERTVTASSLAAPVQHKDTSAAERRTRMVTTGQRNRVVQQVTTAKPIPKQISEHLAQINHTYKDSVVVKPVIPKDDKMKEKNFSKTWVAPVVGVAAVALVFLVLVLRFYNKFRKKTNPSLEPVDQEKDARGDLEEGHHFKDKDAATMKENHSNMTKPQRARCLSGSGSPAESEEQLLGPDSGVSSGSSNTSGSTDSIQDKGSLRTADRLQQCPLSPSSCNVNYVAEEPVTEGNEGCGDCKANQANTFRKGKNMLSGEKCARVRQGPEMQYVESECEYLLCAAGDFSHASGTCDTSCIPSTSTSLNSSECDYSERLTTSESLPAERGGGIQDYGDLSSISDQSNPKPGLMLTTEGGEIVGGQVKPQVSTTRSSELPGIVDPFNLTPLPRPSGLGQNESTTQPKQPISSFATNNNVLRDTVEVSSMDVEARSMHPSVADDDIGQPRGASAHLGPVQAQDTSGPSVYHYSGHQTQPNQAKNDQATFNRFYAETFCKGKLKQPKPFSTKVLELSSPPSSSEIDQKKLSEAEKNSAGITCDEIPEIVKGDIAKRLDHLQQQERVLTLRKLADLCGMKAEEVAGDYRGADLLSLLAKNRCSLQVFLRACSQINHWDIVQLIINERATKYH